MPVQPREKVDIPDVSVPTWVFGSPFERLSEDPIILDSEQPDTCFLSLSSYRLWSKYFACGIRKRGFSVGDKLLLVSGNTIAYPVVMMGTLMAGGIITGTSPRAGFATLVHQIKQLSPRFVITSREGLSNVQEALTGAGVSEDCLFCYDQECLRHDLRTFSLNVEEGRHWTSLLDRQGDTFAWEPFASANQLAAINYTSGSTGLPKGVMASHRNLVANGLQFTVRQRNDPFAPENGFPATWVMWTPMYHVIGFTQYCTIGPRRNIKNYIMAGFDLDTLLRNIERYKATETVLLPLIIISMLHHPATQRYDLSSLRVIHSGGSPMRDATIERFRALLPNKSIKIRQGWGMTEITAAAITPVPPDDDDPSSVGELLPNCEAKVLTPDGKRELGENEAGELWIRSPNVTQGYLCEPQLTTETFFSNGWIKTGDLGYFDHNLNWHIKDRIQDIIYSDDGRYTLPTDLESDLLVIPGVKDAGVTSIPLQSNQELKAPRAFIVLEERSELTTKEIELQFNANHSHQRLTAGIFQTAQIPRLPSGKVNRTALRNLEVE